MKKLFIGLSALPFLAVAALAAKPIPLTDAQMETIAAGQGDSAAAIAVSNVQAVAMGNLSADTNAMNVENVDSRMDIALDLSRGSASAASVISRASVVVTSQSAAALIFPTVP
jgi:hypothetical protein